MRITCIHVHAVRRPCMKDDSCGSESYTAQQQTQQIKGHFLGAPQGKPHANFINISAYISTCIHNIMCTLKTSF